MNSEKVGVIVGRGKEQDHLEMVVAFSEREKAPKLGSFLVVEEQEFMKRKFLCRVEDMNYGDFQATKDERIRAIVEKYMREIGGYGRELSEEEKKTHNQAESQMESISQGTENQIGKITEH